MSSLFKRWLPIILLAVILLAGCDCTDEQITSFLILVDGPADGAVVGSKPTFSWHDEESCTPASYLIAIARRTSGGLNGYSANPPGAAQSHTWDYDLPAGYKYSWNMFAMSDPDHASSVTPSRTFYVGPFCDSQQLQKPSLIAPAADEWISGGPYEFGWQYEGGCLPTSYDYQFASDPGFTNIIDQGTTPDHQQKLDLTFPNCSSLFWRVRAKNGSASGPWSDAAQFHWVTDDTCWQLHYQSEGGGRIAVRLYEDYCTLTGTHPPEGVGLAQGCMLQTNNWVVTADGKKTSLDHWMDKYAAELGAGPCPSAGLDSRVMKGDKIYFYVTTPGTYCVSISRSQVVDNQGTDISLLKGIWTDPRTYDVAAMRTVEMGPLDQDAEVRFGWDRVDEIFLTFPLEKVNKCYFGPETHCPVVEFTEAGSMIPLLARDEAQEWMLTEVNGTPCYIQLPGSLIDQYLTEYDDTGSRAADLLVYLQPPPCDLQEVQKTCSDYTSRSGCEAAGCVWYDFAAGGKCLGPE